MYKDINKLTCNDIYRSKKRFCLVIYTYACASVSVYCVHDTYLYEIPRI